MGVLEIVEVLLDKVDKWKNVFIFNFLEFFFFGGEIRKVCGIFLMCLVYVLLFVGIFVGMFR